MKMVNLDKAAIIVKKPEISIGLERYKFFRENLFVEDITKDQRYQNEFRTFYQMRRFYSDDFAKQFFEILESLKTEKELSYEEVLMRLYEIRGTFEMSFSSKLLHTIFPEYPIWDSVVTRNHFNIKGPYNSCKDKRAVCVSRYAIFKARFYEYLDTKEGRELIKLFDAQFPDNGISNVKKVDFILWQDR